MKLKCERNTLLNAIQTVNKAVASKNSMSIVECILIDATEDEIKLTANNLELAIESAVDGEIEEPGTVALEARILQDIVRHLPNNTVTISVDNDALTKITCEKSKFKINGRRADEFPRLPKVEKDDPLTISHTALKDMVRQTIFSIADNEKNKVMAGELLEVRDNELKLVSLDGHRVSIRQAKLRNSHSDVRAIIPGKTLNEVSKILSNDPEQTVDIFFTEKHILFEFGDTVVVSRLIEGDYFKLDQMLNMSFETKIDVNKMDFLSCIERAVLLTNESNKKPIIITISDNNMELKIESSIGSMHESIEITQDGQDIMIGFNPKFLIDVLKAVDDDEISLYMINPKSPCAIKDETESYIYIVLPVNFTA